ncbi:MAG: hypothetical protein MRZ79_27820 [Bacteroidia bacterium]|nr:hypothetical protein [Bacteroidia bacterium]
MSETLIPLLEAVEFHRVITEGGSTYPWIVTATDGRTRSQYVVKLYKQDHQYRPNNKEIIASVLLDEFDLNTPEFALINFSENFISTLSPEIKLRLEGIDTKPKFATKYLPGVETFSPSLHFKELSKYNIESIYAFDKLIRNVDRRIGKPNILFGESEAFLIDHELSLNVNQVVIEKVENEDWSYLKDNNPKSEHVFLKALKEAKSLDDELTFDTFDFYLNLLNPRKLIPYQEKMEELNFEVDDFVDIIRYLQIVKEKRPSFIQALRNSVNDE